MGVIHQWINGNWNLTDVAGHLWILSKEEPGVPSTVDKTRPLMLAAQLYKIFDHAYYNNFKHYWDATIGQYQAGGRVGAARREIICMKTIEDIKANKWIKYIDVRAAYDSIYG
jgi:hypothetical protein